MGSVTDEEEIMTSNSQVISNLKPALVWRHFAALADRPRPSGYEQEVKTYVIAWAEDNGFKCYSDDIGNLIVKVPGRGVGVEAEPVILQGHLDMVCEKNSGVDHDFFKDPIQLRLEGDRLYAKQTTLGADNGIGVALSMAAGDGVYGDHPPLELLFTIDEETGMSGALNLDGRYLAGRRLINLDAEEEGVLYVGCAGGRDLVASRRLDWDAVEPGTLAVRLSLTGLRGGHSGLDIIKNRGNAIRLLSQILIQLPRKGVDLRLCRFEGGSKRNAIPREATAVVRVRAELLARLPEILEAQMSELKKLHTDSEANFDLHIEALQGDDIPPVKEIVAQGLLSYCFSQATGVVTMSQSIPGLVETSNNLGVVTWSEDLVTVTSCSRSSNGAALDQLCDQLASVAHLCGLSVRSDAGYPGWLPDLSSPMLAITKEVFAEYYGREPEVTAIHAGLECGILGERVPGLDMISFGPDIQDAHSPDESVCPESVAVVHEQLGHLLRALC